MAKKILIVEDEAEFVLMLGIQAKSRGYECELDISGTECIFKAKKFEPDIILMDMNLPRISGLGLIMELKRHTELRNIPIIVLSAHNQSEVVQEALDRGANAYYTKGCDFGDLFEIINEYVCENSSSFNEIDEFQISL